MTVLRLTFDYRIILATRFVAYLDDFFIAFGCYNLVMSDDALKSMLDRKGTSDFVEKHLKELLTALESLVDYGTNLIARSFVSSPRQFKDSYILFVHLQQFVAHLDSVAELMRKGSCLSANLQLRSILENFLILKWIFDANTDNKIEHIFVANLRRRRAWQAIALPGTPEAIRHSIAAARLKTTPSAISSVAKEIAQIDKLLAETPKVAINAEFEKFNKKRGFDPQWYTLCGARSIRHIATSLGRKQDYDYIYGPFSGVSHGGDIWKSIMFRKNKFEVHQIRTVKEIPSLSQLAANYAVEVYRLILTAYRVEELERFNQRYFADWREPFRKKYNFVIAPKFVEI